MKKNIIIIGAGGHAESCIDIIESKNIYKVKCLVGLNKEINKLVLGKFKVIYSDSSIIKLAKKYKYALIAIGQIHSSSIRKKFFKKLKKYKFILPTIISSNAVVSKYSEIGEGTIVMHGAIIGPNVKIGKNCIINSNSLIEHGTNIKDNTHVATSAVVNSGVSIGSDCFIGSNSVIRQSINIKKNSFIKMGSKI